MRWLGNPIRWIRGILPGIFILFLGVIIYLMVSLATLGVPDSWKNEIEHQLANQGLNIKFSSIKLNIFQGLVAYDVTLPSSDPSAPKISLSRLEINVDFNQLLRGNVKVERLQLSKSSITLPLNATQNLRIEDIQADISLGENEQWTIHKLNGIVEGIHLQIKAQLDAQGWQKLFLTSSSDEKANWQQPIITALDTLQHFSWDKKTPPTLTISLNGKLEDLKSLIVTSKVSIPNLKIRNIPFHDIKLTGSFQRDIVTLDQFTWHDNVGSFSLSGSLALESRTALFDLATRSQLPRLIQEFFELKLPDSIKFESDPSLKCSGEINFSNGWDSAPDYKILGSASLAKPKLRGVNFENFSCLFSAKNGDFFLDDIKLIHKKGELTGKFMSRDHIYRAKFKSTLPPEAIDRLVQDPDAHEELSQLQFLENGIPLLEIEAKISQQNPETEYEAQVSANFTNCIFHKVPLKQAKTDMAISPGKIDFTKTFVELGTKTGGTAQAKLMKLNWRTWLLDVNDFSAQLLPGEFLKLVDDDISDFFKMFVFRTPPKITGNGILDLKKSLRQMNAKLNFSSNRIVDVKILGTVLPMESPSTQIHLLGTKVRVNRLKAQLWGGNVDGNLIFSVNANEGYSGQIQTRDMNLALIGRHFGAKLNTGKINASIDMSAPNMKINSLKATGNAELINGNLLEVPFFGPLSPLLGSVLGVIPGFGQLAGSTIKDATCPYWIEDGLLKANQFVARGQGLKLTGAGSVDLKTLQIAMNVRMHTRGLLGILTFPLYPLGKIFQFKADGSLADPKWAINPFGLND